MSGYIKTKKNWRSTPDMWRVSKALRRLSNLGMNFSSGVFSNVRGIGIYDSDLSRNAGAENVFKFEDSVYDIFRGFSFTDSSMHKNISLYDKQYSEEKRNEFRKLALQDEIEEILDILCDETICYNDNGMFCEVLAENILMDEKKSEEMKKAFNDIYTYFGFYDPNMAWTYFRRLLVDGFLSFEILYDGDKKDRTTQKNIIGFQELDTLSLVPAVSRETGEKIWIQYPNDPARQRVLYDSQVIYISYSQFDSACRTSYVERLVRSFNLLRIMESTRIIWAVSNASFKTLFTIPVDGMGNRGKQTLAETMHNYKEVVDFNWDSGELKVNGQPMMPFSKEYWFPSVNGERPEMQTLGGDGPDISDTEAMRYFRNKLYQASKIPMTRFDLQQGRGTYTISAEGMMREEVKFANFINRLRSVFKEIIIKPLYIQMCLKHQEYITDTNFRNTLNLKFVSDNIFTEKREMEIIQSKVDFIGSIMQTLVVNDGENDVPYWDMDYLIRRFGGFSQEDLDNNAEIMERKSLEKEGYKPEDIEKIMKGADKSKFKPEKKKDEDEGEGGGEGGEDNGGGHFSL